MGTVAINGILSSIVMLLSIFRTARADWQANHPGEDTPGDWTDESLVADLRADSSALVEKSKRLQAKFGEPV